MNFLASLCFHNTSFWYKNKGEKKPKTYSSLSMSFYRHQILPLCKKCYKLTLVDNILNNASWHSIKFPLQIDQESCSNYSRGRGGIQIYMTKRWTEYNKESKRKRFWHILWFLAILGSVDLARNESGEWDAVANIILELSNKCDNQVNTPKSCLRYIETINLTPTLTGCTVNQ